MSKCGFWHVMYAFLPALKVVVLAFDECLFCQKLQGTFLGVNSNMSIPCWHSKGMLCYDVGGRLDFQ